MQFWTAKYLNDFVDMRTVIGLNKMLNTRGMKKKGKK